MSDQFIGVDVGGTKIAIAKLQDGVLTDGELIHTEQSSQEALVEQLVGGGRVGAAGRTRGRSVSAFLR